MADWRKKLADEIARQGRDMKEVSLKAGLGETYVRDAIKRGRGKLENLIKVAAVLGQPPEWLTSDIPAKPVERPKKEKGFSPKILPGTELVTVRDFPIYAAAMGGNGNLIVTFEPVEIVKRPAILEGVSGAYGILVVGDSMEPAYRQGDMALVHPGLPPARNEDVVLYDHPPDGNCEAILKHLVAWTSTEWILRQWNPPREWSEFMIDWPTCHRVVGKYSRR
ncbi:XRE family transcriptional regulator [Blastochloris tepida]|uniref:HTH cro/C1-type domain-containing protein n=1 Tax=Blastochloris tepida TaxID=2233851 RepID=A0A348G1B8_9HYPH|nr:S24 family peptidase [Blastochloris tepida]BBF93351.1 hypothetical protein BLTE_20360 [Blastochloris tepida]